MHSVFAMVSSYLLCMEKNDQKLNEDIIQRHPVAAIATALGQAGIAVIRVSGQGSLEQVSKIFSGKKLTDQKSHTIHYGFIKRDGKVVDEVLVSVFKTPHSYTGEDSVEISCHGGALITQEVLEAVLSTGIRHAEPGEFTHRAFINGKLTLEQAEAVADLIHAKSKKAVETAHQQLEGRLGEHVKVFRQQVIDATAMIELELDFIEEDVEFANKEELHRLLTELNVEIEKLLDTYETGRLVKNGVKTVLAGLPNAGKSTLMNTLMGKERAIVSATAGTTRDVIDADWSYDGLLFTLTDTAGIRHTLDEIEAEGVKRSHKAISEADIVVYLRDLSEPYSQDDEAQLDIIRKNWPDVPLLLVGSKADEKIADQVSVDLEISAKTGNGILELKKRMKEEVLSDQDLDTTGILVTSTRHRDALQKAREHISSALQALDDGMTGDFLSIDLRAALQDLGTITGEITNEDVLDSIFSRFCIGK